MPEINKHIILRILNRRKIIAQQRPNKFFDSSAIGDIAFLLLIFFIVTGSFILRQGIYFSLPSKNASSVSIEQKYITYVTPENAGFSINGKHLDRSRLKEILAAKREMSKKNILVICMKPSIKYKRLIDTLSLAKETGIKRVSLKKEAL